MYFIMDQNCADLFSLVYIDAYPIHYGRTYRYYGMDTVKQFGSLRERQRKSFCSTVQMPVWSPQLLFTRSLIPYTFSKCIIIIFLYNKSKLPACMHGIYFILSFIHHSLKKCITSQRQVNLIFDKYVWFHSDSHARSLIYIHVKIIF